MPIAARAFGKSVPGFLTIFVLILKIGAQEFPFSAASKGDGVELRSYPSDRYQKKGELSAGEKVTVLSRLEQRFLRNGALDYWYSVQNSRGETGFVFAGDLSISDEYRRGHFWNLAPSETRVPLQGIWGASCEDVWAVGYNGTVLRYNGTKFSPVSGFGDSYFSAIWGAGPAAVFAVGWHETSLMSYDGKQWVSMPWARDDLFGVWGIDGSHVWAVGEKGRIYFFDGKKWATQPTPATESLRDVWGAAPDDVWAVGDAGTLLHFDGRKWSDVQADLPLHRDPRGTGKASPGTTRLYLTGIWGSAANDIWAVGHHGKILRYDGKVWRTVEDPVIAKDQNNLTDVFGLSATDVWVVGWGSPIRHFDGWKWTAGEKFNLYDVWSCAPERSWAVGTDGLILKTK